jgi:hypothetical protein
MVSDLHQSVHWSDFVVYNFINFNHHNFSVFFSSR